MLLVQFWGEYNSRELLTAKTATTLELAQKDRLALVFVPPLGNQEITKENIYSDRGLRNIIYFNHIKLKKKTSGNNEVFQ